MATTVKIDEFESIFNEFFQESLNTSSSFTVEYSKEVSKKYKHSVTYTSTIKNDKFKYYWFTDLGIYKTYKIDQIDLFAEEFLAFYRALTGVDSFTFAFVESK